MSLLYNASSNCIGNNHAVDPAPQQNRLRSYTYAPAAVDKTLQEIIAVTHIRIIRQEGIGLTILCYSKYLAVPQISPPLKKSRDFRNSEKKPSPKFCKRQWILNIKKRKFCRLVYIHLVLEKLWESTRAFGCWPTCWPYKNYLYFIALPISHSYLDFFPCSHASRMLFILGFEQPCFLLLEATSPGKLQLSSTAISSSLN